MNEEISPFLTWPFIGLSVVLSAVAQLLFRHGMMHIDFVGDPLPQDEWLRGLWWMYSDTIVSVGIGLIAYVGSLISWLFVLSRLNLSYAYPMLSLSYILVYLGAVYWPGLGESPSLAKLGGIFLIFIGVTLIAYKNSYEVSLSEKSNDQRI